MLGAKRHAQVKVELGRETFKIQRAFRGYWARRVRNEMLYDRETGYRNDMIAELQVTLHFL